jgi:SAM-dependent methyltransferase
VDINESLIQRNRENAQRLGLSNVEFQVADLASLSFPCCFDLVVSIDVLEHIRRQGETLAHLWVALKPGGLAFLHLPTVRDRPVPLSRWLTGSHAWAAKEHVAEARTAEDFVSTVRGAGFQILRTYRTFGYFTGMPATSLFALPYAATALNRAILGLLALPCRALAMADTLNMERTRYAVAVPVRKPGEAG